MAPDAADRSAGARVAAVTRSREATVRFGEALAPLLRDGDAVAMDGDLGAGKTAMAEGIARGLRVRGAVSSPTFTLLVDHEAGPSGLPMHHFDAYRLADADEFLRLGFDEVLASGGVAVVEWASRVAGALPDARVRVALTRRDGEGEDVRAVSVAFPAGRESDAAALARALRGIPGAEEAAPC